MKLHSMFYKVMNDHNQQGSISDDYLVEWVVSVNPTYQRSNSQIKQPFTLNYYEN